jgi:hypothetical protein
MRGSPHISCCDMMGIEKLLHSDAAKILVAAIALGM